MAKFSEKNKLVSQKKQHIFWVLTSKFLLGDLIKIRLCDYGRLHPQSIVLIIPTQ